MLLVGIRGTGESPVGTLLGRNVGCTYRGGKGREK